MGDKHAMAAMMASGCLLLALCLPACAEEHVPAVSVRLDGSNIVIDATVTLPVRPCEAYAMLTDYDRLPDFIPGMLTSRYRRISSDTVSVTQVGEVHVFIFHMQMKSVLEMQETPDRRIVFRQTEGDMTTSYSGEWNFSAAGEGSAVEYGATMSFESFVPLSLARSVLKNEVTARFAAIAREAQRRKVENLLACAAD